MGRSYFGFDKVRGEACVLFVILPVCSRPSTFEERYLWGQVSYPGGRLDYLSLTPERFIAWKEVDYAATP